MFSLVVCPLWLLISSVRNIIQRPGWGIALIRISMPLITYAIAITNGDLQWKLSDAHADRVIKACDKFQAANGRYPKTLDELVPKYLTSIPPAKHCIMGQFNYDASTNYATLSWTRYGFYRRFYSFDERRWSNLD